MASCPKVVSRPDDVTVRLAEIGGLTRDVLVEAALLGEQARRNCTMNDAVTAPGMMAYYARVRGLRDQLCPKGWKGKCDRGSEKVISPDKQHAIVVSSGDENTGNPHADVDPKTKCPKGTLMEEAAERNEEQLSLFADPNVGSTDAVLSEIEETPAAFTWVFLVSIKKDLLMMELSLPVKLGTDGRVDEWSERIVLLSVPMDGGTGLSVAPVGPEPTPAIDVSVSRKTA
jgi:hypothetical protein